MGTAGTLVINVLMNTAGVTSGITGMEAQLKAFQAQISGASVAARAQAAADAVARAQDVVGLAANRQTIAQMRATLATQQLAAAHTKLAAVQADATATTEAVTSASTAETAASIRLESAKTAQIAATIGLRDAEAGLAAAQEVAANPPTIRGNQFPLITAAVSFASLAVLKFGDDAAKSAAQFEFQMRLIQTQARANTLEMQNMSNAVLEMAPSVQAGPEELAKGLFHVESVGYRGAQALGLLRTAAQGAAVGNANLEDVTNALVAAVTTGISGTQNFSEAMGVLNATVGVGNLRMEDLAKSLSSGVLATAKQFGLTLTDVGAALATMADQGIPAEEAATRLRITIALLGAPTKLATQSLEKIGLTQRDLASAMRSPSGLLGALDLLKQKMDSANLDPIAQSQLLKNAFGGSRSSAGILTLINSTDLMRKKLEDLNQAKLEFPARFAEEADTAEAKFRSFSAALQVMSIRIGQGVLPVATVLAQVLGFLAQQTIVTLPLFTALTAAMTIWATTSTYKFIMSMFRIATTWVANRLGAEALKATVQELAANTDGLAAAQTNLAAVYERTLPVLSGSATAMEAQSEAAAANLIVVGKETEALAPLVAGLSGVDGAVAATTESTGALVAGLASADGAIEATTASSGPLVTAMDLQTTALRASAEAGGGLVAAYTGVDGAAEKVVASTGPVITGLEAETAAYKQATVAAQALAAAQAENAAAGGASLLAGAAPAVAPVVAKGLGSSIPIIGSIVSSLAALAPQMVAIGKLFGTLLGKAMGIAIPIAIGAVIVVGVVSLFKAVFLPQIDQVAKDFKAHIQDAIDSARLGDLKRYADTIDEQLAQSKQGFHPIEDFFGATPVNALQDASDAVHAKIDSLMKDDGISAADGFAAGFSDQSQSNSQDLASSFEKSLAGVSAAAATLGTADMDKYAQGVADAEDAPVNAYKNMVDQIKKSLSPAEQIAQDVGILTSQALADGLANADPRAVAAAEALRKHVTDDLDRITGGAYTIGTQAGITWQEAFTKSLQANGATQDQIDVALSKLTPQQIEAYKAEFVSLGDEWRNHLAPSSAAAATAFKKMADSLDQTKSVADQATEFLDKFGEDIGKIKTIAEGSGSDLMDAIAKGIEDRRAAPLDALKKLHADLQDSFDKNREIALLWAELQSKDIAEGLKNGDPLVVAQTEATISHITERLDELTGGAYSRSLNAGNAVGAGLADAQGTVTAGATTAVSGVGPVMDGTVAASAASGAAAGAANAGGFASQAGVIVSSIRDVFKPVVKFFNDLEGAFFSIGKALGFNLSSGIGAGMTGTEGHAGKLADDLAGVGAAASAAMGPTKSWMDYLNGALKGNGDMAKYLQDQLNGVVHTAASARSDMTTAFANIKASAEQYFDALHEKNLQAIQDARDHKNALLDTKEALNKAPVTAAQKALDFQRQQIQEWRLRQAVANAQTPQERRDAILALQDFLAQKHIDEMSAEADSADAVLEAEKKKNDALAAQQTKAENERYAQQKKDFDRELAALQRFLANHPAEWSKTQADVIKLLGKYGVDYNTAGAALGTDFVTGLRSQIAAAYQAAKDLAAAGAGVAPTAPPPPTTVSGPGGVKNVPGGNTLHPGAIPLATGSFQILKDNLLALLHKDEMVVPADAADLLRSISGMASPWRNVSAGLSAPHATSPRLGSPDASQGGSAPRSGGTLIVKIGEEALYEITDRGLAIQDDIYGGPRVVTGSRR